VISVFNETYQEAPKGGIDVQVYIYICDSAFAGFHPHKLFITSVCSKEADAILRSKMSEAAWKGS
jgi:hypothetical protein